LWKGGDNRKISEPNCLDKEFGGLEVSRMREFNLRVSGVGGWWWIEMVFGFKF